MRQDEGARAPHTSAAVALMFWLFRQASRWTGGRGSLRGADGRMHRGHPRQVDTLTNDGHHIGTLYNHHRIVIESLTNHYLIDSKLLNEAQREALFEVQA